MKKPYKIKWHEPIQAICIVRHPTGKIDPKNIYPTRMRNDFKLEVNEKVISVLIMPTNLNPRKSTVIKIPKKNNANKTRKGRD